jgi:hypothetical protein
MPEWQQRKAAGSHQHRNQPGVKTRRKTRKALCPAGKAAGALKLDNLISGRKSRNGEENLSLRFNEILT